MAAEKAPYIEEVVIHVREGYELVPLPEGSSYLGFIFARGARLPARGGDAVVEGREPLTLHAYAVYTGAADSAMVPTCGPVINALEAELLKLANAQFLPQATATMLGLRHQALMGVRGIGDASV